MRELRGYLRRAGKRIRAEYVRAALLRVRPAEGAVSGREHGVFGLALVGARKYLGDHVVRAAYEHAGAYADALPFYIVVIVKGRLSDGRPHQFNGLNVRERGELARAADLPGDVADHRGLLLRREFIGDGAAGEPVRIAQSLGLVHIVELYNHSVDIEIEREAALLGLFDLAYHVLYAAGESKIVYGEAVFTQEIEHLGLKAEFPPLYIAHVVGGEIEPP